MTAGDALKTKNYKKNHSSILKGKKFLLCIVIKFYSFI